MNERRTAFRALVSRTSDRRLPTAVATILLASVALAGCSSVIPSEDRAQTAKVDPKLGVKPSPRVVAMGEPVPKGGGKAMVGKPYKVAGKKYVPQLDPDYEKVGYASWYGDAFHGRRTANGEIFDSNHLSAAHPTMPLPSYARVTSLETGRSVVVRVNDRGPFHSNRLIDISRRTADMLGVRAAGIAKVRVEYVGPAPVHGDDTEFLVASYRGPADQPAGVPETMLASAGSLPGVAARATSTVAGAAWNLVAGSGEAETAAAPTLVASAADVGPVGPAASGEVLPPVRPAFTEVAYVVVASADPADTFLASGPTYAAADIPAVEAVGYTPASFQAGPATSGAPLPPEPPVFVRSYAADRIDQAYAAVEDMGQGVALSELVERLETMSAPPTGGPSIQAGLFADPQNATRLAAALRDVGRVAVDPVTVNGRVLQRVRVSALSVSVEKAVEAAERAGARGVQVLR